MFVIDVSYDLKTIKFVPVTSFRSIKLSFTRLDENVIKYQKINNSLVFDFN